jgi:hypothetical protein
VGFKRFFASALVVALAVVGFQTASSAISVSPNIRRLTPSAITQFATSGTQVGVEASDGEAYLARPAGPTSLTVQRVFMTGAADGPAHTIVIDPTGHTSYVTQVAAEPGTGNAWIVADTVDGPNTSTITGIATYLIRVAPNGTELQRIKVSVAALPGEPYGYMLGSGIAVDANNVYVVGDARGTLGTATMHDATDHDVAIAAYSRATGALVWAQGGFSGDNADFTNSKLAQIGRGDLYFQYTRSGGASAADDGTILAGFTATGTKEFDFTLSTVVANNSLVVAPTNPGMGSILANVVTTPGATPVLEMINVYYAPPMVAATYPVSASSAVFGPQGPIVAGSTTTGFGGEPMRGSTDDFVAGLDQTGSTVLWTSEIGATSATTNAATTLLYDDANAGTIGRLLVAGRTTGELTGTFTGGDDFVAGYQPYTVPGPITNLVLSSFNQALLATWTASPANPLQTQYDVWVSGPTGTVASTSTTDTQVYFSGLTNGVSYTVTVLALNPLGDSPTVSGTLTVYGPPSTPTNVAAEPHDGSATMVWSPSVGNGAPVSSYRVYIVGTSTYVSVPGTSTSAGFGGLVDGQSYQFVVYAFSGSQVSSGGYSNTITPFGPPSTPTGIIGLAGDQAVIVAWNASTPNGAPVSRYLVHSTDGSINAFVLGTQTSAYLTGLTNGRSYTFMVSAWSGGYASAPSTGLTMTPGPSVSVDNGYWGVGTKAYTIRATIRLSHTSTLPVTASWATVGGSAVSGVDFIAASGTVTIPVGATTAQVPITVLANRKRVSGVSFNVKITSATNASIGAAGNIVLA